MICEDLDSFVASLPQNRAIAGLDLGDKTIGVAVSDLSRSIATPIEVIRREKFTLDAARLLELIKAREGKAIVLGLPLNMDGSEQPLTTMARKFGQRLHGRFGLLVEFCDERLTTAAARETLFDRGGFRALNKGNVDCQSAVLILESWLQAGRS